jgi:DNA-directed RNA polymerase I subunit RPA12
MKAGYRPTRPFGPLVPDVTSSLWLKRKTPDFRVIEEEQKIKHDAADIIMPDEAPLPKWVEKIVEVKTDTFEHSSLFCQYCGTFLDLKKAGKIVCSGCDKVTHFTNGQTLMASHAVVKFPEHKAWMDRLKTKPKQEKSKIGAQRAEVSEECPKCKFPKMFFWTQQLRSADEGQTVFYECGSCAHRFAVNT